MKTTNGFRKCNTRNCNALVLLACININLGGPLYVPIILMHERLAHPIKTCEDVG
jgi:hypothetical protein